MSPFAKLRFYIFDWDDNVLFVNTTIELEEHVNGEWVARPFTTSEYAQVRGELRTATHFRYPLKAGAPDYGRAYANFSDQPNQPSRFLVDVQAALAAGRLGPSYACFIEALVSGSLFMICTARAHRPSSLREGVEFIIAQVLTPAQRQQMHESLAGYFTYYKQRPAPDYDTLVNWYLGKCGFTPVNSPEFQATLRNDTHGERELADAKYVAVDRFISYATGLFYRYADKIEQMSIGYSDDDAANVDAIFTLFRQKLYPNVRFHLYNTSTKKKEAILV